jgi:enolase-phosphatase E1
MTALFLFDIEGTTTDIHFVHQVLFPYAFKNLETFVLHHQTHPQVASAIEDTRATVWKEEEKKLSLYEAIDKLKNWIEQDRKHPALKEIQGLIWDNGYKKGDFKGHLYSDVKPFFSKLLNHHYQIGIYSSGSVHAQKLIFGFSQEGDLTPLIHHYFDTKVGGKREAESYVLIAQKCGLSPQQIHFFSDIPQELMAAQNAGVKVTQVLRPGTLASGQFKGIRNFEEFLLS